MKQILYISHSLFTAENSELIKKLVSSSTVTRKIVVFDNDAHGYGNDKYSETAGNGSILDVLQFDSKRFQHEDGMASQIFSHLHSLNTSTEHVRSFVVIDDGNISARKMFPNNYVNIEKTIAEKDIQAAEWILSQFGSDSPLSQKTWFIADTHFFHANIIRYCNRPWNSGKTAAREIIVTQDDVARMNEALISNWNSAVGKDDIVWHLGDFSFGKKSNISTVMSKLNGKINLIKGNHDRESVKFYYDAGFHRVYDHPVILNGYIILSHIPCEFLNRNSPFFNIAGHVHDSPAYKTFSESQCIVSVERHGYSPVSWNEIEQKCRQLRGEES